MVCVYDISVDIGGEQMESKKSTTYVYKIEDSAERMDDILDANDNDY